MASNYGYALDPGFKTMLDSVGLRHRDVLRRAGLPEDVLTRGDARVSADQFFSFLRAIEESVADPLFPIRLADGVSAESFAPPVFAALCSPNLTVAMQRLAKFKPLVAPVRLVVQSDDTGLRVSYEWLESAVGPPPCLIGSEALFLVKLARLGTRHEVCATEVTLLELPEERAAFEDYIGCRIRRGDQLSVSFSAIDARRSFLTDNSAMWDIFEPQLREQLADLEGSATFGQRTRAVLLEVLPGGQVGIEVVARRLALSSRTLQRRLRDEGTSFNEVLRETRTSLSRHYLGSTQLSYVEIAYLLAFDEPNSFFRAFQSWTGTTPETARRSLQDA